MYLQVKITLQNITPPVWRRIVLSDEITLLQLHNIIQISFNWTNSHLYQFIIKGWNIDVEEGVVMDEKIGPLFIDTIPLKSFNLKEKESFKYWYDFGDDWMHQIVVEKVTELGSEFPICLAGMRNAPPEDCGGPWGYEELMRKKIAKKLTRDEKEWLGDYDPEYFDIEEVNDVLSDEDCLNEEGFF